MIGTEIIPFELARDWLTKLITLLRERKAERQSEIEKIGNVFGDPLDLAAFYVEPDCQQFNPADYADEDAYHVVREPVFDRIAQFLSGKADRKGKHLLVLSDAGTGKTSLLVMLKLSHLSAAWSKPYSCALLKLGSDSLERIAQIASKPSTVLLLDGLDEDPEAWVDQNKRVRELLAATSNFFRTIITCRTQFLSLNQDPFLRRGRIEIGGYLCPVIYTSLFSDRQVKRYLERRFSDKLQSPDWERRAFEIIQRMGLLSMRPMLLAHIDDLVESEAKEWTLHGVYTALVTAWLLREQRKIFETQNQTVDVQHLLDGCRHAAFVMQSQDRPWIDGEELENHVRARSGVSRISLMQLGVRSLLTRDSEKRYRFSHYSILEYLISDSLASGFVSPLVAGVKPTDLMRAFAASLIRSHPQNSAMVARLKLIGLQGADLSNANLDGIDLSDFNCRGADFANASLAGAEFRSTELDGASFSWASIPRARFSGCSLSVAQLQNSQADGAIFKGCAMQSCDLSHAVLTTVTFSNSDLSASRFISADLRNATLEFVVLESADFGSSNAAGAVFRGVDLMDCRFDGADLSGVTFFDSVARKKSLFSAARCNEQTRLPAFKAG